MKPPINNPQSSCSKSALLEFLDAELTADREQEITTHIQTCPACQSEIRQHQALLIELDNSFDELPKIPNDFSKIVTANARSQIAGVRMPNQQRLALVICLGLLTAVLLAIAAGPLNALSGPTLIFEKAISVTYFLLGLLLDLILGLGIVGRVVAS